MKSLLLIATVLLMLSCSGGTSKPKKTAPPLTPNLAFNGFAMGALLDTLVKKIPTTPTSQTDDELIYENTTAEGVRWHRITYNFVAGKLARVTALQAGNSVRDYQTLYQRLMARYGQPAQNLDSLIIWAGRDAELSLQPGTLLFARR